MFKQFRYKAIIIILLCIVFTLLFFTACTPLYAANPDDTKEDYIVVPILMYHDIRTSNLGKYAISAQEFESDLKYLKENDYTTITMTQLINYVYYNEPLPENPIILSFDDGFLGTYTYAFPLLKQYQMQIVLSITGINVDKQDTDSTYSYLSWQQINEMIDTGYAEVQNHTYNLHTSSNERIGCMQLNGESFADYEEILTEDIQKLQDEIFTITGTTSNTFIYPYGKASENTDIILKKLGFSATLSCEYGINFITKDPETLFGLKRIRRSHGDKLQERIKNAVDQ